MNQNYFNLFRKNSSELNRWQYMLASAPFYLLFSLMMQFKTKNLLSSVLSLLLLIILCYPFAIVSLKRWRDFNTSRKEYEMTLIKSYFYFWIPFVNIVHVFKCCFFKGKAKQEKNITNFQNIMCNLILGVLFFFQFIFGGLKFLFKYYSHLT